MPSMHFSPTDLEHFDVALAEIERNSRDDGELVRRLAELKLPLLANIPEPIKQNPLDKVYRRHVRGMHEEIIGRVHASVLEGLPEVNLDYEASWPYPWGTKSSETVSRVLLAYGFLIRCAGLGFHARVLEVGCGMGSLTWNLARMGYRVDALDPNKDQCEAVRRFTASFPYAPNVHATTLEQWLRVRPKSYKYDAVVFFESFHHLMDHQDSIAEIVENHLEHDGKILLAAEPVFEEENDVLPYPWGPRLDGESLRAMRKWGWLELGFTWSYLKDLFALIGLEATWTKDAVAFPHTSVIRCERSGSGTEYGADSDESRYESEDALAISLSRAGLPNHVEFCTGLTAPEGGGRWSVGPKVVVRFRSVLPTNFSLKLCLQEVFGPNVRKELKVRVGGVCHTARLEPVETKNTYTFSFKNAESDVIEFLIPHPCRPKDLPELHREDARRIGIKILELRLLPS